MSKKELGRSLLCRALNNPSADFRDGQWEAIDALVNKQNRLLVVQRTGWGKSSVYFIATRILRDKGQGPTLIISPLLALMRNQIEAAARLGIRALTINSTNKKDWPEFKTLVKNNTIDALLISPERLANDEFANEVLLPISETIGLLVVDEAHCISDWGHDFRPDYRRLVNILQHMPENIPIIGTTATANDRVINDVKNQLGNIIIQRGPLMRESLSLHNISLPSQLARLAWLAENLNSFYGTGIIYTLTKRDANQVADWLTQHNFTAKAYYSGVEHKDFEDSNTYRQHLESLLLNNKIKVLVATSALGMGYDKPDLGFVIHYQAPGSIVAYYQQVGRAGRGISNAVGVLLSGSEDNAIHEHFRKSAFPKAQWVKSLLTALEATDGLSVSQLLERVNIRRGQIDQALKFLSVSSPAPVIKNGSIWQRTPVFFSMDHEHINRLTQQKAFEWDEITSYFAHSGCLMKFLAQSLDDPNPIPCGRCSNCNKENVITNSFDKEKAEYAKNFLQRSEIKLECKKLIAKGAFKKYEFTHNIPIDLRAEVGRILSRWRDGGWGEAVASDKNNGHFRDELIDAALKMITQRWRPNPKPQWVTCVPSNKNPELVPNYARRLALALDLPFIPIVEKIRENEEQKIQQNLYHQCQNLDGVFNIKSGMPTGAVLLVDDVVDSALTLTIISALLKKAGSGAVFPFALTTSSIGS